MVFAIISYPSVNKTREGKEEGFKMLAYEFIYKINNKTRSYLSSMHWCDN